MIPAPKALQLQPAYRALLDVLDSQFLRPETVARRWGWSEQHLANLRKAGKGPAYVKLGRSVRYTTAEIIAWELSGTSHHVTLDRVALACSALKGYTPDQCADIAAQLATLLARKVHS